MENFFNLLPEIVESIASCSHLTSQHIPFYSNLSCCDTKHSVAERQQSTWKRLKKFNCRRVDNSITLLISTPCRVEGWECMNNWGERHWSRYFPAEHLNRIESFLAFLLRQIIKWNSANSVFLLRYLQPTSIFSFRRKSSMMKLRDENRLEIGLKFHAAKWAFGCLSHFNEGRRWNAWEKQRIFPKLFASKNCFAMEINLSFPSMSKAHSPSINSIKKRAF